MSNNNNNNPNVPQKSLVNFISSGMNFISQGLRGANTLVQKSKTLKLDKIDKSLDNTGDKSVKIIKNGFNSIKNKSVGKIPSGVSNVMDTMYDKLSSGAKAVRQFDNNMEDSLPRVHNFIHGLSASPVLNVMTGGLAKPLSDFLGTVFQGVEKKNLSSVFSKKEQDIPNGFHKDSMVKDILMGMIDPISGRGGLDPANMAFQGLNLLNRFVTGGYLQRGINAFKNNPQSVNSGSITQNRQSGLQQPESLIASQSLSQISNVPNNTNSNPNANTISSPVNNINIAFNVEGNLNGDEKQFNDFSNKIAGALRNQLGVMT